MLHKVVQFLNLLVEVVQPLPFGVRQTLNGPVRIVVESDDVAGDADYRGVRRNVGDYHGAGPNARVLAHLNRADDLRPRADHHPVAQRGMTLDAPRAGAAERHPLVDHHIRANFGSLADNHSHAVVDEEARADRRSGVNFDACQKPRDVHDPARNERHPAPLEGAGEAMREPRVKARVEEHHLRHAAGRRVARHRRPDVVSNVGHRTHPITLRDAAALHHEPDLEILLTLSLNLLATPRGVELCY